MELVITDRFVGLVADRGGSTQSGLRYRLPSPLSIFAEEDKSVVDIVTHVVAVPSFVADPLIWEMDGAVKGPRRYSGAMGTIELDDFISEFDTWCDMMVLCSTKFTPFLAWKRLFQHLEGPPMDDYHEFRRDFDVEIEAWRLYWSPSYVSITHGGVGAAVTGGTSGATPGKTGIGMSIAGGVTPPPPPFNPMTVFFQ